MRSRTRHSELSRHPLLPPQRLITTPSVAYALTMRQIAMALPSVQLSRVATERANSEHVFRVNGCYPLSIVSCYTFLTVLCMYMFPCIPCSQYCHQVYEQLLPFPLSFLCPKGHC